MNHLYRVHEHGAMAKRTVEGKRRSRSARGRLQFVVSSLYPILCRMEKRDWIRGRWVEKPGQRRRRYYRLTRKGRKELREQQRIWVEFAAAIARITGLGHA
jgi:DNA-binding PadR family transcriptional regulator